MKFDVDEEFYHNGLQCSVRGLAYNFITREGSAFLKDGDCVDMVGCIRVFQSIDKRVKFIQTFSGDDVDTAYLCVDAGGHDVDGRSWCSRAPGEDRFYR